MSQRMGSQMKIRSLLHKNSTSVKRSATEKENGKQTFFSAVRQSCLEAVDGVNKLSGKLFRFKGVSAPS